MKTFKPYLIGITIGIVLLFVIPIIGETWLWWMDYVQSWYNK